MSFVYLTKKAVLSKMYIEIEFCHVRKKYVNIKQIKYEQFFKKILSFRTKQKKTPKNL